MASASRSFAQLSSAMIKSPLRPQNPWTCRSCLLFARQTRAATGGTSANAAKYKRNKVQSTAQKKKKQRNTFIYPDLKKAEQFALCDAIQYIRAFEVGRPLQSPKYEIAVRLKTLKNGPVVRNRMRLPHPVKTDLRIAVICPADSAAAKTALAEGARLVGEDEIFEAVKTGKVEFDRCICHSDSLAKLQKAGVARILGPRGLMPSAKLGTVTRDISGTLKNMVGGSEYRERDGTVRLAIAQLGFTPDMVKTNIAALMEQVKKDCALMADKVNKEVHEVVLSSTHSPGFSLNGLFRSPLSAPVEDLSTT